MEEKEREDQEVNVTVIFRERGIIKYKRNESVHKLNAVPLVGKYVNVNNEGGYLVCIAKKEQKGKDVKRWEHAWNPLPCIEMK
jgi:hypothetical protein